MKILVIPDIHLKVDIVERILRHETPDRVIFLGDWFDDFGDTVEDNRATAWWLVRRMRAYPDDVFLWGNHDTSYVYPSGHTKCSGYTSDKADALREVFTYPDRNRFKFVHWEGDNWLFSHAGLTKRLAKDVEPGQTKDWSLEQEKAAKKALVTKASHAFFTAGRARYGPAPFGGVTWCDWSEFVPIPGVNQVYGHTPLTEPTRHRLSVSNVDPTVATENWGIDTHLRHYAIFDGKTLETREIPPLP